jgi:hypothetical protein
MLKSQHRPRKPKVDFQDSYNQMLNKKKDVLLEEYN